MKNALKRSLNLIVHDNYITFDHQTIKQNNGATTDLCVYPWFIPGLLTQSILRLLENNIYKKKKIALYPYTRIRYVDDII